MSHHYVYSHYGHSNYFAGSKNSNYYHSSGTTINVFNYFAKNQNYDSPCNGGFWNGFWGGIGMSLGNMFAPMLGVSLGNIMGGFNFTNPFSTQLWGGSPSAWNYSSLLSGNNTAVAPLSKNKLGDADYAKLNALEKEVDALMDKNGRTQEEIDALKKKVEEYGDKNGDTDNINKADNKAQKERILGKLVQVPKKETAPAPVVQPKENNAEDEDTITINGKPVKITQIKSLEFDELEKLPNKDKATAIGNLSGDDAIKVLNKAGIKPDVYGNYKMSTNYTTLLLYKQAGVAVNVAKNEQAKESMIRGQITDVQIDTNGKIAFTIDNSNIENDMGLTYTFQASDTGNTKFNLTNIKNTSTSAKYIISNWKDRIYEFENGILTINTDALVSKGTANNRAELKKDNELK
jgi:hypothetical protein